MNTLLKNKIISKLTDISTTYEWLEFNNVSWLVDYVEANVVNQHKLWANIEFNYRKSIRSAGKNIRISNAAYCEAKFKLINQNNTHADPLKVVELINEGILNCPLEEKKLLAKLFVLRSIGLYQAKQTEAALANIDMALKLKPTSKLMTYKARYLKELGRVTESLNVLQQLLENNSADVSSSTDSIDIKFPSIRDEQNLELNDHVDSRITKNNGAQTKSEVNHEETDTETEYDENKAFNFDIDYRCTMLEDAGKGRHFVASEEISSGTLLFREKAYSVVLLQGGLQQKCSNCFRSVTNVFWPCASCNEVVYCNEACANQSWDFVHKRDCKLANFWLSRSKSTFHMFKMLNRLGSKTLLELDQGCQFEPYDMQAYMNDPEQRRVQEESKSDQCRLNAYRTAQTLVHHSEKFSKMYTVYHLVNAIECVFVSLMVQGYEFDQIERADIVHLVEMCFVGIRRILINSFRWSEHDDKGNKQHIATCLCLVGSLFNHKCDHNTDWAFENGTIYLSTKRDIKSGEEISICYGYNKNVDFQERQKQNQSYFFQCNCSACLEDSCSVLSLQCRSCPGPVVCNEAVYSDTTETDVPIIEATPKNNATCLLCLEPYPNTAETVQKVKLIRQEIVIITKLFNTGIDKTKYLNIIRQHLETLKDLLYHKSMLLKNDINQCCKILSEQKQIDDCIAYGYMLDQMLPLYGHHDDNMNNMATTMVNNKGILKYSLQSVDSEIDWMIFWADLYKRYIAKHRSQDHEVWNTALRFYYRLFKLIKMVIHNKEKEHQEMGQQSANEDFVSLGQKEEATLLQMLYRFQKNELEALKRQHGQSLVFK